MSSLPKVVRAFFTGSIMFLAIIANTAFLALAERPTTPDTGTPSGNTTPGATRPEAVCGQTAKPLTAIFANQGQDFTVEAYPTFFFYIPYNPQQISLMEFLILNETQTKTVYHSSIQLNNRSGIIKVQLPPETQNLLAVNTTYYWRFNLDCEPDRTIAPDLVLNGWIRRIPVNSDIALDLESAKYKKYLTYKNHSIWYDAIANLAELHFSNPEDKEITEAWTDTLQLLKLDWIISEPLVDAQLQ